MKTESLLPCSCSHLWYLRVRRWKHPRRHLLHLLRWLLHLLWCNSSFFAATGRRLRRLPPSPAPGAVSSRVPNLSLASHSFSFSTGRRAESFRPTSTLRLESMPRLSPASLSSETPSAFTCVLLLIQLRRPIPLKLTSLFLFFFPCAALRVVHCHLPLPSRLLQVQHLRA